ncbi:MAG: MMPL family transporter [Marinobacter sp.]|nr:MMPL family transporter [Marinobacter sp.]
MTTTSLFDRLLQHRIASLLLAFLILGIALAGLRFLKLDPDIRAYASDDSPQLLAFDNLEQTYVKGDNILIVLSVEQGDLFTPQRLDLMEQITELAWTIPYSQRVSSVTNFQHTYAEGDLLTVEDLFEESRSLSTAEIEQRRAIALSSVDLRNALVSPDGTVAGVLVSMNVPLITGKEVTEAVTYARTMIAGLQDKYPDVQLRLVGNKVLNQAFSEASITDLKTLYPVMLLLMMVLLGLVFRGVLVSVVVLTVMVVSSLLALGVMGWSKTELAPIAVSGPVVIMTLAIADCIHILMTYARVLPTHNDPTTAMAVALKSNARAVILTSLTTSIGFLSLNFSDSPPYRAFGNFVAVGVMGAMFFSLVLMPPLVLLLKIRVGTRLSSGARNLPAVAAWLMNHQKPIWLGFLILLVVSAYWIPRNQINDAVYEFFDPAVPFKQDVEFVNDRLTGISTLYFSVPAGEANGVVQPDYLQALGQFTQWLRDQPEVRYVSSLSDTIKRLNRNMHGDDTDYYRIPENAELAGQFLLLYELSLPFGLDLTNTVNLDKSASRVTVYLEKASARELVAFDQRAQNWLSDNVASAYGSRATSIDMMFATVSQSNARGMIASMVFSLIAIALLVGLYLRSWRSGLISLLLNLAPLIVAFGLWGLLVGEVGLAVSTVLGMSMGIVVDNVIHFLNGTTRRIQAGASPTAAIEGTFESVGAAIMANALILGAGFLVLAFSGYAMNADMGVMTTLIIGLALVLHLALLPSLVRLQWRRHRPASVDSADRTVWAEPASTAAD